MELGAHLPLIDLGGETRSLAHLRGYAEAASSLGYSFLCANDHLVYARPWLDGPTALAAVIEPSQELTLATTVTLPVVRGPLATAKTLSALDILSGGRLVAGVSAGSSQRDYVAVGIPFEERWQRLDEAVSTLRALWNPAAGSFQGRFYSTEGIGLEPRPAQPVPIWIGSWGSAAGLRRVARLADGWLASGYNTTPERFADCRSRLSELLASFGRDPATFPNAVATMWLYVTDKRGAAARILEDVLSPMLGRSVEALREVALPIGSAETCSEVLEDYAAAGAERIFVWPLGDDIRQLELASRLTA
jgi:alkanesulfonate monooxygenase SsuD/methylene tetrahydromethanopterin reductase-like flavin-dependent oxidoreductase (luciferase family)